jgi:hypothetical protein
VSLSRTEIINSRGAKLRNGVEMRAESPQMRDQRPFSSFLHSSFSPVSTPIWATEYSFGAGFGVGVPSAGFVQRHSFGCKLSYLPQRFWVSRSLAKHDLIWLDVICHFDDLNINLFAESDKRDFEMILPVVEQLSNT